MYTERFDRALSWASALHRQQVRKGSGTPYVNHLLAVAALVGEAGGTEDQVIAALLHDSIEDCIGDVPDIRRQIGERFGDDVLEIVEACTDADTIPKPPWRERKEAYLTRLRKKGKGNPALLVSCADKLHNARSITADYREMGEELWDRFRGGRDGTLWYYRELAAVLDEELVGPLGRELGLVVAELQRLAAAEIF